MTTIIRRVHSQAEVDELMAEFAENLAQSIALAAHDIIEESARTQDQRTTISQDLGEYYANKQDSARTQDQRTTISQDLGEYYANKQMPVYSGALFSSMSEVSKEGNSFVFTFGAGHASDIERGGGMPLQQAMADPNFRQWVKDRDAGHLFHTLKTDPGHLIGVTEHPFIRPGIKEALSMVKDLAAAEARKTFT